MRSIGRSGAGNQIRCCPGAGRFAFNPFLLLRGSFFRAMRSAWSSAEIGIVSPRAVQVPTKPPCFQL